MIHKFRINNYQSIRETIELNFRVPGTTPEMSCFRRSRSRPDIRLPSVLVLVGPNGSGKTALLRAIAATVRFATNSYMQHPLSEGIPEFIPFLAPDTRIAPTRIETEFDVVSFLSSFQETDTLVRYTLELGRDNKHNLVPTSVGYEALHTFPRGRPRRILERCRDRPIYISRELGVRPQDDRLSSIPPNASVISTLAGMGVEPFVAIAKDMSNVQINIAAGPDPWRFDTKTVTQIYQDNQNLVADVSNKLQQFDLGIGCMKLRELVDGNWLVVFEHEGLDMPVILDNESAGTRHLVQIFPQLHSVLKSGHLAIMDVLGSEFHPELSAEILSWFRQKQTNPAKAQLICSNHNLSVLDSLEKEEVFIVEKDHKGVTRVHGAGDVRGLRRDGNLQKQYRSGTIGGMPTFG